MKLPRSFYDRDTTVVAQELLGKHLVHRVDGVERVGRIVETERRRPHRSIADAANGPMRPNNAMLIATAAEMAARLQPNSASSGTMRRPVSHGCRP